MQASPKAPVTIGDHTLEVDPIIEFGYLTLTTDAKTLTISFKDAPRGKPVTQLDFVTLDLTKGVITASSAGASAGGGKTSTTSKSGKTTKGSKTSTTSRSGKATKTTKTRSHH